MIAAPETDAPAWWHPAVLVATLGGLGRAGFAPGTWGAAAGLLLASAVALGAAWAAERFAAGTRAAPRAAEAVAVAVVCLAGIPICSRAAALLGRGKDPGCIVIDEAAAMAATLLVVPPAARTPAVLAAAFLLFRVFDIAKPFPCDRCERLPTGLGIMADDWAAAAYAGGCLATIRWLGWL
jgi:phosphatidylglycerophosphatase A